MKIYLHFFVTTVLFYLLLLPSLQAQDKGNEIFKNDCGACHTIGRGKLVGPDLANVKTRHSDEWIINFVKSSQSVIRKGDKYADSLFKAFNQMPMPDHPNLTDEQIKGVIAYIEEKSAAPSSTVATIQLPPGNVNRGKELFVGKVRFVNNGAACNSCHNVDMKGFISGGALAKDLTHVVTRLSATGVEGIVSGLPFPQMKQTYALHPVLPQEIADITAFLTRVDKQAPVVATSDMGKYLLIGGGCGIIVLIVLYSFFWFKRKKRPVNFSVFKRQLTSV